MRGAIAKVQYSAHWRWSNVLLFSVVLVWLAGCGGARKVNYHNGRYHSAQEMARLKAANRRRGNAPLVRSKTTTTNARGTTTKIVTKRAAPAPLPANVSRSMVTVIETARSYQGTPYKFGGTTRLGMDCSGLLYNAFAAINVQIPRSSNEQAVWGEPVKPQNLQIGDLVFFGAAPGSATITHVGLVTQATAEDVQFIHASSSLGVTENSFDTDYFLSRFIKAVRPRL